MGRQIRTYALDFDGVLHKYEGTKVDRIQGPLPGAKEAVWELCAQGLTVVVFTTRAASIVAPWLRQHGFPEMEVTSTKRPFFVLVDDRAVTFEGRWEPKMLRRITEFKPHWWQQKKGAAS